MPICEDCNKWFNSKWLRICPECKSKERESDMKVGD